MYIILDHKLTAVREASPFIGYGRQLHRRGSLMRFGGPAPDSSSKAVLLQTAAVYGVSQVDLQPLHRGTFTTRSPSRRRGRTPVTRSGMRPSSPVVSVLSANINEHHFIFFVQSLALLAIGLLQLPASVALQEVSSVSVYHTYIMRMCTKDKVIILGNGFLDRYQILW